MTETTTRPKRRTRQATVVSVEPLTPHMIRVVVAATTSTG
jgi:NADPH-dependent ferric siderophore reductase